MEDLFVKSSLCYLTNRCDEGFQLIYSYLILFDEQIQLNDENQQIFCLISMKILRDRYESLMKLRHGKMSFQLIENYFNEIRNELKILLDKMFFLIEKRFSSNDFSSLFKLMSELYLISNSSSSAQSLNKIINKQMNINT